MRVMHFMTATMVITVCVGILSGCVSMPADEWAHVRQWGWPVQGNAQAKAISHFLASVIYERQGDQDRAAAELALVAQHDPDAVTPTLRMIRNHLRAQDYDQALAMCERAVQQAPDRPNLWIVLGEIYHHFQRYDDAMGAFKKAIELNPENMLGYGALVELQESTNDLVAAIDVYQRLIELNPELAGLHYQLGINLARIKDVAAARAAFNRALELNPNLLQARYTLGVLCLDAGDNEESAAHLQHYLRWRMDDINAMEHLAGALTRIGRYDDAFNLFSAILAGDQVTPQHHIETMCLLLLAGKPELAEKSAPPGGAPIIGTFFTALARQDKEEPYLPLLESLDDIEGDLDAECNEHLNALLYLFGKDTAGDWLLSRIARLREESGSRALGLIHARVFMSLERHGEAVQTLMPLLGSASHDPWIHYYLAICHEKLGHFENTEAHLEQYLQYNPDDAEALNFLGYLYAERGVKLDKAEAILQRALKLSPDNPYYLDSLGWVFYRQGRADEALDYIRRAIYGMDTDDAVLRDHLGDVYLLKGDIPRALSEWERARRLDPTIKGVPEKIEQYKDRATGEEPKKKRRKR